MNKEINKRIETKAAAKAAAEAETRRRTTEAAAAAAAAAKAKTSTVATTVAATPAAAPVAATPAAAPAAAPPTAAAEPVLIPTVAPAAAPAAAPAPAAARGGAGRAVDIGPKFLTQDAFDALSAPQQYATLQSINQQNLRAANITLEDNKSKAVYEAQYAKYRRFLNEKSLAASQARQASKAADASTKAAKPSKIEQFYRMTDPSIEQTIPAVNEMLTQLQELPETGGGLTPKQINALNKMLPLLKTSQDSDLKRTFQTNSIIGRARKVLIAVKSLGSA